MIGRNVGCHETHLVRQKLGDAVLYVDLENEAKGVPDCTDDGALDKRSR